MFLLAGNGINMSITSHNGKKKQVLIIAKKLLNLS